MALSSLAVKDKLWKLLWTIRQERMGSSVPLAGRARLPRTSGDKLFWITDKPVCRLVTFAFSHVPTIAAYF